MIPIIAYYRASKYEQTNSIEVQRHQMKEFISKNNDRYFLFREYFELHTGKDRKRAQLTEAIKQCTIEKCTLGFTKIDRLSRVASHLLQIRECGIELKCLDMPELNTLTFGIFATIAQHERELISARTKAALAIVRKTKKLGNPNGWDKNQEKAQKSRLDARLLWLNSDDAGRAKKIIELTQNSKTFNFNLIARNLNFQKIPTQRGGIWQSNLVKKFIKDIQDIKNNKY